MDRRIGQGVVTRRLVRKWSASIGAMRRTGCSQISSATQPLAPHAMAKARRVDRQPVRRIDAALVLLAAVGHHDILETARHVPGGAGAGPVAQGGGGRTRDTVALDPMELDAGTKPHESQSRQRPRSRPGSRARSHQAAIAPAADRRSRSQPTIAPCARSRARYGPAC
jgi:hypothetical protein